MSEFVENDIRVRVASSSSSAQSSDHLVDSAHPKSAPVFYNPRMRMNRDFVLLSLMTEVQNFREPITVPIVCLDAFSATGIMAAQWKHSLKQAIVSVACDANESAVSAIQTTCQINCLPYKMTTTLHLSNYQSEPESSLLIVHDKVNSLMESAPFDFIHLDPFGSCASHLESAFRHLRHNGILSMTFTDISTLMGRNGPTLERHYSAKAVKTSYAPELAVRIVLANVARAAARCNKGIKVLYCLSRSHFLLLAVRVVRGATHANQSLQLICPLLHCLICQDRCYLSNMSAPIENPYSHLSCRCFKDHSGKTAVVLGPVWSATLFDKLFVTKMNGLVTTNENSKILKTILEESIVDIQIPYFLPKCTKLYHTDTPKLQSILQELRSRYIVSTLTHFDPSGFRANATVSDIVMAIASCRNLPVGDNMYKCIKGTWTFTDN